MTAINVNTTNISTSSTASNALMLLLKEDPRLVELKLTSFADTTSLLLCPSHHHQQQQQQQQQISTTCLSHNSNRGSSSSSSNSSSNNNNSNTTIISPNEEAAFAFAAALMHEDSSPEISGWISPSIQNSGSDVQSRAKEALADVDRKLALVCGLAERLVRDCPEQVSESLLKLHGFRTTTNDSTTKASSHVEDRTATTSGNTHDIQDTTTTTPTAVRNGNVSNHHNNDNLIITLRNKCDRLTRQSQLMESIASRVETSIQKQYDKLRNCTMRLQRVLALSHTLKMAMQLQFEGKKILGCGLDILEDPQQQQLLQQSGAAIPIAATPSTRSKALVDVDLRDLTRAASSVATMESLLADPELYGKVDGDSGSNAATEALNIVVAMKPEVERAALSVRRLAASLLAEQQSLHGASTSSTKLGGILQIYFHLNELPQAVWSAVSSSLSAVEKAAAEIFNPKAIQRIRETATLEAKAALMDAEQQQLAEVGSAVASSGVGSSATGAGGGGITGAPGSTALRKKKQTEQQLDRLVAKKIKEQRAELASRWANSVSEATLQIAALQRVLSMKSDPVSRKNFLQVVATSAEVPHQFVQANKYLVQMVYNNTASSGINNNTQQQQHLHILNLFWTQMCLSLGNRLSRLLKYENGKLVDEVAALYPALRAASLSMLCTIDEDPGKTRGMYGDTDSGLHGVIGAGILGGSSLLKDDYWNIQQQQQQEQQGEYSSGKSSFMKISADSWTCDSYSEGDSSTTTQNNPNVVSSSSASISGSSSSSSIHRFEWKILTGEFGGRRGGDKYFENIIGFSLLQSSFIENSSKRLCAPLPGLFVQNQMLMDASGAEGISGVPSLPTLPSRYDLQTIESLVRDHLALADPRQGGGEFGMIPVLCATINDMVVQFLSAAQEATSFASENFGDSFSGVVEMGEKYLRGDDLSPSEALLHDVKLAGVISTLSHAIQSAPDNTFLAPYRPSQSAQHEEAARLCKVALHPSIKAMNSVVNKTILNPLYRALNQRLSRALAKMHLGAYLEDSSDALREVDGFVQTNLAPLYEHISSKHLLKLPSEYGYRVACTVAAYSMYAFASNISLVRPLGEKGRLKITQDLADLELALEHFVTVTGGGETVMSNTSSPLGQIDGGKPYAELRAVRSMIFWHGFNDENSEKKTASEIASELLSQDWIKDVRPSTALHFLFCLAPDLLSSPHHSKRISAQEYVDTLVRYDGSVEDGEANAWMTTMTCCDSYQQRESLEGVASIPSGSGDRRVASVLMILGPELLRQKRR